MQNLHVRSVYRCEDPPFETIYNQRTNAPRLWYQTNYVRCGAPHREKQEENTHFLWSSFLMFFSRLTGVFQNFKVRTPSCMVFMSWWQASFREGWMYEAVHERSVLHVIDDSEWCQLAFLSLAPAALEDPSLSGHLTAQEGNSETPVSFTQPTKLTKALCEAAKVYGVRPLASVLTNNTTTPTKNPPSTGGPLPGGPRCRIKLKDPR